MKINSPAGWIVFAVIVVLLAVVVGSQAGPVGAIMFLALGGFIGLMAYNQSKTDENYQKNKQEFIQNRETKKYQKHVSKGDPQQTERFYRECVREGIRDLRRPADKARLELYAKNHGIQGSTEDLMAAFEKGKEEAAKSDRAAKEAAHKERIQQLREEEKQISNANRAFANCFGQDKPIKMCEAEIARCDQRLQELENAYNSVISGASAFMQKKGDWAIAGGIANGLAGPAAGVATAIDVMQKNAEIDKNNQAVTNLSFGMQSQIVSQQIAVKEEKARWLSRLEKAKTRLVQELPQDQLMSLLSCRVTEKKISETGAIRLKVSVEQTKPLRIYEDVKAVVDGSIQVLVYDGKEKNRNCAKGMICLPLEGCVPFTQEVICKGDASVSSIDKCKFDFKANKLWGVEV